MKDTSLLEGIKTRIDNLNVEILAAKKIKAHTVVNSLVKKLSVQQEAYDFNVWLTWKGLSEYPYKDTKIDLVLISHSSNVKKK